MKKFSILSLIAILVLSGVGCNRTSDDWSDTETTIESILDYTCVVKLSIEDAAGLPVENVAEKLFFEWMCEAVTQEDALAHHISEANNFSIKSFKPIEYDENNEAVAWAVTGELDIKYANCKQLKNYQLDGNETHSYVVSKIDSYYTFSAKPLEHENG